MTATLDEAGRAIAAGARLTYQQRRALLAHLYGPNATNKNVSADCNRMREALIAFRRAKAFVAADAYDGIDDRGRELLEIADSLAALALDESPAAQPPHEKG